MNLSAFWDGLCSLRGPGPLGLHSLWIPLAKAPSSQLQALFHIAVCFQILVLSPAIRRVSWQVVVHSSMPMQDTCHILLEMSGYSFLDKKKLRSCKGARKEQPARAASSWFPFPHQPSAQGRQHGFCWPWRNISPSKDFGEQRVCGQSVPWEIAASWYERWYHRLVNRMGWVPGEVCEMNQIKQNW